MEKKASSSARCWISFLAVALMAFYLGYIPAHLSFEEHSHSATTTETDSHHHEHEAEHQPHSSADHSIDFVSKPSVSFLAFDFVVPEIAICLELPTALPISFSQPSKIPDESPPDRFSPRGPPLV